MQKTLLIPIAALGLLASIAHADAPSAKAADTPAATEWIALRCTPVDVESVKDAAMDDRLSALTLSEIDGRRNAVAKVYHPTLGGDRLRGQWNVSWKSGEAVGDQARADVYTDDATGGSTLTLTLLSFGEQKNKPNAKARIDGKDYRLFCKYAGRSF